MKTNMKWGEHRDPGFEYPSDVRLDDFKGEENMEDNVNRRRNGSGTASDDSEKRDENEESEGEEEEEVSQSRFKSWWSYLVPYNYLH